MAKAKPKAARRRHGTPEFTEPVDSKEMENRYLQGLKFPARKSQVMDMARSNGAPGRVMEVLLRLEDRSYRSMNRLLEAVGDLAASHG